MRLAVVRVRPFLARDRPVLDVHDPIGEAEETRVVRHDEDGPPALLRRR
jgi:hypothetical protein